jgi:tetratricopeptide (TPR) repeat protein
MFRDSMWGRLLTCGGLSTRLPAVRTGPARQVNNLPHKDKEHQCSRFWLLAVLFTSVLPAQTLQQAETLWKQRRPQEAEAVYRAICDGQRPRDPDCKVKWGRMYLDFGRPEEAAKLFNEALEIDKDNGGAMLGEALLASDEFSGTAAPMARKALELDPKLVEAQELLARLALEDNDNTKAVQEAKKALEMDRRGQSGSGIHRSAGRQT